LQPLSDNASGKQIGVVIVELFGIGAFLWWLVVVEAFSFAVLPYVAWMCPGAPDRGYGISKLVGPFLLAASLWICTLSGVNPGGEILPIFLSCVLLLVGYLGYSRGVVSRVELKKLLREYGPSVEGVFLGITCVYGIIRFLNPEIFWGEKPMDSTFLNFFVRNNSLPPQDPWASGSPMSYYYLGLYFIAALLKVSGIPVAYGFNFAMATLAGWIGCALFSLCVLLTKNRRYAFWCAWLLLFASNPEVMRLIVVNIWSGTSFNFDTVFWPSTRVFTSPSFLEYTSWSLLFADLHAHVIAIPFTVTALVLAAMISLDPDSRYTARGFLVRILLGVVVGALFGCNTWDFISYGGVVGVVLLAARVPLFWDPPRDKHDKPYIGEVVLSVGFSRLVAGVWDLFVFGFATGLTVWLYTKAVAFNPQGGWGYAGSQEFNATIKILRVIGYWLLGSLAVSGCLLWGFRQAGYRMSIGQRLLAGLAALLALAPGIMSSFSGHHSLPWGIFVICSMVCVVAGALLWMERREAYELKVLAIFMGGFSILICVLEVFFLLDRMNTLFKGYMAVWTLSGVATVVGAYYAYGLLKQYASKQIIRCAHVVTALTIASLLIGTAVNVYAVVARKRVPTRHYTFDGTAYLHEMNPDDAALIDWFNAHVSGTPIIVEAQGGGYREYTRIAMHTGLPTVLGWEHHAKQRGLSSQSALERRKAIKIIYSSDSIDEVREALLKYRVDYVVVGKIERNTYRRFTQELFDKDSELFTHVASFGETSLYATYFSKYNPNYKSEKDL
jgi:YYY domain-containing protein